ncbi:VOC family protein [Elioraea rosea]|uniref:VOC family protein n=1 Tax=Elioraea rosea TaxID=2492390 RepID=UPI00118203C2|nr:VOC family protein [Elioraea rosea]
MTTETLGQRDTRTDTLIAGLTLRVGDAERVARFYREVIGLDDIARDGTETALGVGGRRLLTLIADPAAPPAPRGSAGLFHTAFLLPSRRDLGLWLRAIAEKGVALEGASDHLVSEAIYLSDPEGNGIEVYADRAPETWQRQGGQVVMATEPLDLRALAEASPGPVPATAPAGTVIGHVHLRVGNVAEAERFWTGVAGLEVSAHYADAAVFLARNGYHHHLAANAWGSRGAGRRPEGVRGLVEVAFDAALEGPVTDPWGNRVVER